MKKLSIRLIGLLAVAFAALPCSAQLAMYEYWIDDYAYGFTGKLSGYEQTVEKSLDVGALSPGLHTFFFRAVQADGKFSPVYTSRFLKFNATNDALVEYWVDDYFNHRDTVRVKDGNGTVVRELNLADNGKYPAGFHTLYFRVAQKNGNYSPIYSSSFMKFDPSKQEQVLEYWFDDGYDNMHETMELPASADGVMPLNLENMAKFPLGLHQLHMRVVMAGSKYSPVYSACVMRLPMSNGANVRFWLDDDYDNGYIEHGIIVGDTVNLTCQLDLSTVTPGMHRLHYRITHDEYDNGPVYEEPVLVHSRYRRDGNPNIGARRHWVDDDAEGKGELVVPSLVYIDNFSLDPWDYTAGKQHAYHVAYLNSAGVWSETNTTYFYIDPMGSGRIVLGLMPEDMVTDGIDKGIDDGNGDGDAPVYNLSGIKVGIQSDMDKLPSGIYIVSGKKVVVNPRQ